MDNLHEVFELPTPKDELEASSKSNQIPYEPHPPRMSFKKPLELHPAVNKPPKNVAIHQHENPSNFNTKVSRVEVPNISEEPNQQIADKPQLPRMPIENFCI